MKNAMVLLAIVMLCCLVASASAQCSNCQNGSCGVQWKAKAPLLAPAQVVIPAKDTTMVYKADGSTVLLVPATATVIRAANIRMVFANRPLLHLAQNIRADVCAGLKAVGTRLGQLLRRR